MKHTQGKIIEVDDIIFSVEGATVFSMPEDAKRFKALWNASDGMTNDEAVRYLTHGAEMVERLKGIHESFGLIKENMPEGICKASVAGYFLTKDTKLASLLALMEGK